MIRRQNGEKVSMELRREGVASSNAGREADRHPRHLSHAQRPLKNKTATGSAPHSREKRYTTETGVGREAKNLEALEGCGRGRIQRWPRQMATGKAERRTENQNWERGKETVSPSQLLPFSPALQMPPKRL